VEGAFEPCCGDVGEAIGLREDQASQLDKIRLGEAVEKELSDGAEGLPYVGCLVERVREGVGESVRQLRVGPEDDLGEEMFLVLELLVDEFTPRPLGT
jgi:hypothetical protein